MVPRVAATSASVLPIRGLSAGFLNPINNTLSALPPTSAVEALYPDRWLSRKLGNLSNDIPWEVVGQYEVQLFIHDSENNMMFETSVITMTHGLGHALLYCYDKHRRYKLTIDDLSGNRKGDEINWFVAAVHNRTNRSAIIQRPSDAEIDNTIYYLQTYREFFPRIWKKVKYRVFDFRDDLR